MTRRRLFTAVLVAVAVAACAVDTPPTPPAATPGVASSTAAAVATPTASPTPDRRDPRAAEFDAIIDEHLASGWYPNAIVGIWSPQGSYVRTVGTTAGRPVSPKDHVRIASVTKTFTVTLLLQLADEGKLSLDDPIDKYVPGTPNPTATLYQLATMTSGFPDHADMEAVDKALEADRQRMWTSDEIMGFLKGQPPLWAPGDGMHYANSNTVALGIVVEKVGGKPYGTLVQERICGPLGLTETRYNPGPDLPEPYLSGTTDLGEIGHAPLEATHFSTSILGAAGGMVSTLDDMHTWAVALATGKGGLLKPSTQAARVASVATTVPGNSDKHSYGLGLIRHRGWLGHSGEVPGYTTMVEYKPETQTTVVVFVGSNIYAENVERPAQALFHVLLEKVG